MNERKAAVVYGGLAVLFGALAIGPGCKKKQQETQYPPQQNLVPEAGAPAPTTTADAAPPPPATDAGVMTEGGAQPLDIVTMQAMQDFIKERAKKDARGMKPYGDFIGGVVDEGGSIQHAIMIDSGKCYAVVGLGAPSVLELDIQIQARPGLPVPLPGPIIAVDSNQGPEASVSPCWKNPFPLSFPAAVVIKATRGKGAVGAQVYVK